MQPEYGIGAVTPGDGVYVRGPDGLSDEEVAAAVEESKAKAALLDRRLHAEHGPLDLAGKTVLVVDDGLATGGTMIAALRWTRAAGARRIVAAVPVAAEESLGLVRAEADEVVCLYPLSAFLAVGIWYRSFDQVDDAEVVRFLDQNRRDRAALRQAEQVRASAEPPPAPNVNADDVRDREQIERWSRNRAGWDDRLSN